jgi:hypothetical protein
MYGKNCTEGVTLEELLCYPMDLLVLVGAEGDEDEDDERDADDPDKPKDNEDDDRDGDDPDKKKKDDEPGDPARAIQNLTEDRDRQWRKRKAAEEDASELRKQLAAAQANGTQDEELKKQVTQVTETNERLLAQNRTLSLQNAFLQDNAYAWEDSEAALALVDLSGVEIDDDGKVQGMKVALDKLAKAKPYLVKKPVKKTSDTPSGNNPRGKNGQQTEAQRKAQEDELIRKYPALRNKGRRR